MHAIILGVIQGITEWLPVSSSGHLVLAQQYFGLDVPVAFDVILHFGTLLVVLVVFWRDIITILSSLFRLRWDENTRLLLYIAIATLPIALVGFFLKDFIKSLFQSTIAVGIALLVTGTVLYLTKIVKHKKDLGWRDAFFVGLAQAVALVPGISRSGSTISAGLLLGIKREKIARFSFLIFIPAVIGAGVLELGELSSVEFLPVLVGTLVSVVVGYVSLKWLLRMVKKGNFYHFSWYCWILGIVVLILALL